MPTSTVGADVHRKTPSARWAIRGALLLGLVALWLVSLVPLHAPEPAGRRTPVEEFSAARAFDHVEALAAEPHPVGSEAHRRVRQELIRRIEALGLDARVQRTVATRLRGSDRTRAAWVHNVATRLEGSAGADDAVLMVAHYDSVLGSYGAADDAAGVAVLLESLRALQAGGPLTHDVIALFTDAEEWGLLGAEAFLHDHPWADDVRLVLNFEARGASGPSIMFETGPGTGPLLRRFARVSPRPLAASYSYDVYRRLPNDTDFTLFKQRELPGFNFAFIGERHKYHTVLDTAENLSRGSLQHHGDHGLSLARHFASADDLVDLPRGGPATYFALPGLGLVTYPSAWSPVLAGLLALAALVLWIVGLRKERMSVKGTAIAGGLTVASVAVATAVVVMLHRLLAEPLGLEADQLTMTHTYLLGLEALAAALVTAGLLLVYRGLRADRIAGIAFLWALLAGLTAFAAPSTSYLMIWPLAGLVMLLGILAVRSSTPTPALWTLLLLLAAVPALWLWPPTLRLLGDAFGVVGAGPLLTALLGALGTTLVTPQLQALAGDGRGRQALPAALAALGVVAVVAAAATAGYGIERPRATHVLYLLDEDAGEARWASLERQPSEWTRQFLGDDSQGAVMAPFVPAAWPKLRVAPAPTAPLPPPRIEVTGTSSAEDGRRRVQLALDSALEGYLLRLLISSDSRLVGWRLAGRDLELPEPGDDGEHTLEIVGLPDEGLALEVVLDGDGPLRIDAVDQATGLPKIAGVSWEPRPETLMPSHFVPTDLRMVRKQFVLETTPPEAPLEDGGST